MPPKAGAMFFTMLIISLSFCVARHIGNASIFANSLKRTHLPSMTGNEASAPILPKPRTALPSVTTATEFAFMV